MAHRPQHHAHIKSHAPILTSHVDAQKHSSHFLAKYSVPSSISHIFVVALRDALIQHWNQNNLQLNFYSRWSQKLVREYLPPPPPLPHTESWVYPQSAAFLSELISSPARNAYQNRQPEKQPF